jgi:hypothetical protein
MTDILVFHSARDAIAGERKLLDAGIDAQPLPAPKTISPGCGICLLANHADIGKVRLILGNSIRGICPETEFEERFGRKEQEI